MFRHFSRVMLSVLSLLLIAGCGSDPAAPLSAFQPEIVNNPDSFAFQATGLSGVTATVSYDWQNSGTRASVDHSSTVTAGTAEVRIYDANDSLMYSSGLLASGTEQTTAGAAGTWRIVVVLTGCEGTLNFRAQKL